MLAFLKCLFNAYMRFPELQRVEFRFHKKKENPEAVHPFKFSKMRIASFNSFR